MNLADSVYGTHCWVFSPYTQARKSGLVSRATAEEMGIILDSVCSRLTQLMMNSAGSEFPEAEVQVLHSQNGIAVLDEREGGIESRHLAFASGIIKDAYLSIVAKRPDGRWVYTLGKRSRYSRLDIAGTFKALNAIEGFQSPRGWGGGDLIGGSDRESGSGLGYEEILAEVRVN